MWQVLLFLLLGLYCWRRWQMYHSKLPPGPFNIPLLGSWEMLKLYFNNGDLSEMYQRLGHKYGPVVFMRIAMDTPIIAIRSYEVIKEASTNPLLGGMAQPFLNRLLTDFRDLGISFSNGAHRVNNRKFLSRMLGKYAFHNKQLEMDATHECSLAVEMLRASKGQRFDIKDAMILANNTSFKIIFGHRFEPNDPYFMQVKRQIADIFLSISKVQTYLDFLPWLKNMSLDYTRSKATLENLYSYVNKIIAEHQSSFDPATDEPHDIVDEYLAVLASRDPGTRSLDDLRVYVKDLIVASAEGPSLMLIWMLMLLAKHQKLQARLHEELDRELGGRPARLSDEDVCVFTRAVIDETVRYVTLTPFNRHDTSHGATSLHGYHIPANSIVLVDQRSMHHDPAVWGDPQVFRPERFLEGDGAKLRSHVRGWGFSPRQCPAETYSRSLLFLFLSGVMQKFRLRLPEGAQLVDDGMYGVGVRLAHTEVIVEER